MDEQRKRSEFQGSGEVAVEGVFQAIADRVGATKFLGYEATAAQVQDRRAGRRRPGGRTRSALIRRTSRSSPPRRRSTASRAARWATPARSRRAQARELIVRDMQAARCRRCGSTSARCSRASCASATPSSSPSTPSAATTSAATTRRRTCCTGRCATCWARTSRRRARWSRPIACASTSRTRRR